MGLEMQLILKLVGWLFLCLRVYRVFASNCGYCIRDLCDEATDKCLIGCQLGFFGQGCHQSCKSITECRNPCYCSQPCECDFQMLKCNQTRCFKIRRAVKKTKDVSWVLTITGVVAASACLGLITFLCCNQRRKSARAGRLRGELLSLPCFNLCPQVRDEMLRKGGHLGLPGFQLGARDSLDTIGGDDEYMAKEQSNAFRHWRRQKATVVGVKQERHMVLSSNSGYRWKRKWKDRKEASKQKRKLKHEQRKLRKMGGEQKRGSIILPPTSIRRKISPRPLGIGRRGSNAASLLLHRRGSRGGALLSVPKMREYTLPVPDLPDPSASQNPSSSQVDALHPETGPVHDLPRLPIELPPPPVPDTPPPATQPPPEGSDSTPSNHLSSSESTPSSPNTQSPLPSEAVPVTVPLDVCENSRKHPSAEEIDAGQSPSASCDTSSDSSSGFSRERHSSNVDSLVHQSESSIGDLVFCTVMDVLDQNKKKKDVTETENNPQVAS